MSSYVEPNAITIDCPVCQRSAGQVCYEIAQVCGPDGGTAYDVPYDLNPGQYHYARQNAANLAAATRRPPPVD